MAFFELIGTPSLGTHCMALLLRPSNRVQEPIPRSARIQKAPVGALRILAERVGLSLRDQACGSAAVPVEQGPKS